MPNEEYWDRIGNLAQKYLPEYSGNTAVLDRPEPVDNNDYWARIDDMAKKYLPEAKEVNQNISVQQTAAQPISVAQPAISQEQTASPGQEITGQQASNEYFWGNPNSQEQQFYQQQGGYPADNEIQKRAIASEMTQSPEELNAKQQIDRQKAAEGDIERAEALQGVDRKSPEFDWEAALSGSENKEFMVRAAKEFGINLSNFLKLPAPLEGTGLGLPGKPPLQNLPGQVVGGIIQGVNRATGAAVGLAAMAGSETADDISRKIIDINDAIDKGFKATKSSYIGNMLRGAVSSLTEMFIGSLTGVKYAQYIEPVLSQANQSYQQGKKSGLTGKALAGYVISNAAAEAIYSLAMRGIGKKLNLPLEGIEAKFDQVKPELKAGMSELGKRLGWGTLGELTEEELTTLHQALTDKIMTGDPNALNAQAFLDTGVQTLMTMGLAEGHSVLSIMNDHINKNTEGAKAIDDFTKKPSRKNAKALPEDVKKAAESDDININSATGRKQLANKAELVIENANIQPTEAIEATPVEAKPEQAAITPEPQNNAAEAVTETITPEPLPIQKTDKVKRTAGAISMIAKSLGQKIGEDIIIVNNMDEARDYMSKGHIKDRENKQGNMRGFFSKKSGKIVLVADNLDSGKQARTTLLHELVGHKGVHALEGVTQKLKDIAKDMPDSMRSDLLEIAKRRNFNMDTARGRYIALNEYIGELAPRHEHNSTIQRLINVVKGALYKAGITNSTDAFARDLLNRSKANLEQGAKAVNEQITPAPAEGSLAANRARIESIKQKMKDNNLELSDLSKDDAVFLASINEVTGLKNKLAYAYRKNEKKHKASIDGDYLKSVNDSLGHDAGNKLLQSIAEELDAQKGIDAFHTSGDEFVAEADNADHLKNAMETARKNLEERNLTYTDEDGIVTPFKTSFSYGIAEDLRVADRRMKNEKDRRKAENPELVRGAGAKAMAQDVEARRQANNRPATTEKTEVTKAVENIQNNNLSDDIQEVIGQVGGFVRDESTLSKIRNRLKELALEAMKKPDAAKAEKVVDIKIKKYLGKAGKKLGVKTVGLTSNAMAKRIKKAITKTVSSAVDTTKKITKTEKQLHKITLKAEEKAAAKGHKAGKQEGKKEGERKATYKQTAITYLQKMVDPANVGDLLNKAKKVHTEASLSKFMDLVDNVTRGDKVLPERVLMTKKALDKMMKKVAEKHAKINYRAGQDRILNMHRFLEEYARKLPPAIRGKVLKAITKAKTIGQFNKAIERIDVVEAHEEHRKALSDTKKTVKAIKKRYQSDFMSMNPHYRDLMNNLIGAIDITKMSEKKKKYAENLLQMISEDKSIWDRLNKNNRRLLERVGREPLSDMDTDELNDLTEAIKLIDFRQKRMRIYKKNGKNRKISEIVDGVKKTMKYVIDRGLAVGTKKGERSIANRGFGRKALDYFAIGTKLMLEIADAMNRSGPLMSSIGKSIQEAGDNHDRNNAEINDYIQKGMEKRGLSESDTDRWGGGKKTDIVEVKLKSKDKNGKDRILRMNKWTLASLALTLQDQKGGKIAIRNRLHYSEPVKSNTPGKDVTYRDVMDDLGSDKRGIQLGRPVNRKEASNRFESVQEDANAIIEAANSDKKLAKWMDLFRDFADNKAFPMLNEAIIESEDRELRKVSNWMPLTKEKKGLSAAISVLKSYNDKYNVLKDYQSRKDRTSAEHYDLRINPLNQIFADTKKNVVAINAFQPVADDVTAIFGQEDINVALDRMHGKGFSTGLIERLNALMGNVDEPKGAVQRIARNVKSKLTGAKLLASPSVLISQTLSYFEAATEINKKYLLDHQVLLGENSKANREILDLVRSNKVSPKLKARKEGRGFDRDLKDRAHVDAFDEMIGKKNWYQESSGKPMSFMDNVAISRIILAANKQAQAETGKSATDHETIMKTKEIAERAIDNTQVSSEVYNRTGFSQSRNAVARLFGFFRGYLDANLQNTVRSILRYRYQHGNKAKLAHDIAVTQILPTILNMSRKHGYSAAVGMLASLILGYKEPDDDKDKDKKDALKMAHGLAVEFAQEGLGKVPILGNTAKGAIEWMKEKPKWYNITKAGDVTGPVSSYLVNGVKIPWYMNNINTIINKKSKAKTSRAKKKLDIAENTQIINMLEAIINLGSESTGIPIEGIARPVIKGLKAEQKAKAASMKRKRGRRARH